jgi:tetratricopeptide (TPR) repeat protein
MKQAFIFTFYSICLIISGTLMAQQDENADMTANINELFTRVNEVAQQLQTSLTDLETSIQASQDSIEQGAQVLDDMLASVTAVHDHLNEDSAIWSQLDALLALWQRRYDEALTHSEADPAFLPIVQAWQDKLETARALRNQISTERANSMALIQSIEADRAIVLAYYELGQADKALESLRKVSENLSHLNDNMQQIVQTASEVQHTPISQ